MPCGGLHGCGPAPSLATASHRTIPVRPSCGRYIWPVRGQTDLEELLADLRPERRPGAYVFVVAPDRRAVPAVDVLASVLEPEGLTLVASQEQADRAGLDYEFVAGWITLRVHSALAAVGLTAAVSGALAGAGISCNLLAGYHHDHLLVPLDRVEEALGVLDELRRRASDRRALPEGVTVRRAVAADADAMRGLARAAYARCVPRLGREPAPMGIDYQDVVARGDAWLAEHGGQLAGLLVLVPAADHLLIENVAVAPRLQGRGIGGHLLRLAEEQARARRLPEVRLYTNEAMTENLTYYQRHGYRETYRMTHDGDRRVFFSKAVGRGGGRPSA